ncbi:hypothetical protein BWQ96_08290 [Gracilariopsis chorda]|uniref:Uncharacterized protein n=1 Tax=Gracilariopsis chorda TaxID=448386 RepID=A0A2V3IIX6_9FLOR|nr:hypothetical protein BWQ96_08290 [Gracilariopsis chorda]|eukprot:PXF41983.1 hypothetical protein BWQ96_08290 [Gracilariopsis chorda]
MAFMLFTLNCCSQQKNIFLSRVEELDATAVSKVICSVYKTGDSSTASQSFPDGFATLVRLYIRKARHKQISSDSSHDAALVWSILLGPQPRDDSLLDHFCKAATETNSGLLLCELLSTSKSKSFIEDKFMRRIAAARALQLTYPRPALSNQQSHAFIPRHPGVTEFLRSNRTSMEYYGFEWIRHARNFAYKHFSGVYNSVEKHSARAEPHGRGNGAYATIVKTSAYYNRLVRQFEADQRELGEVKKFLGQTPNEVKTQALQSTNLRLGKHPDSDVVYRTGD